MYSQSLLAYSINYPSKSNIPSQPIFLPPLNISSGTSAAPKISREVLHPPTASTVHHSYQLPHPLSHYTTSANVGSSHFHLTEKNLYHNNYYSGIPSPPKSISSVGSSSPESLPSLLRSVPIMEQHHAQPHQEILPKPQVQTHTQPQAQAQPQAAESNKIIPDSTSSASASSTNKRRQRSGPSCDSCRQRKVKCNAEINILTADPEEYEARYLQFNLSDAHLSSLLNGQPVNLSLPEGDCKLIIQNQKLVKYSSCKSCDNKNLPCCFSKGFTKEDIIYLSKRSSSAPLSPKLESFKISKKISCPSSSFSSPKSLPASTIPLNSAISIAKKSPTKRSNSKEDSPNRKSSCMLCRQRKVKCIFNEELGKCEGCHRKNKSCSFL